MAAGPPRADAPAVTPAAAPGGPQRDTPVPVAVAQAAHLRDVTRLWQRVRHLLVAYAVLQVGVYAPVDDAAPLVPAWAVLVGVVVLLLAASAVVSAGVRGARDLRTAARAGLAVDLLVASSVTVAFATDPEASVWALLVLPLLQAAGLGRRRGALGGWVLTSVAATAAVLIDGAGTGAGVDLRAVAPHVAVLGLVALVVAEMTESSYRGLLALEDARAAVAERADRDDLTGVVARDRFLADLDAGLASRDAGGSPLRLLYVDLDGFAAVNETYGHAGGDAVLVAVARRLEALCGPDDRVARLAGDEFVVCERGMPAGSKAEGARRRHALQASLAEPFAVGDGGVARLGVSVGVASAQTGDTAATLLARADAALLETRRARASQRLLGPAVGVPRQVGGEDLPTAPRPGDA